jgi:hypothetical protein
VWRFFHFDPIRDVKLGSVKLVYFDYPTGKIKTWNKWIPKRGHAPKQAPDKVEDISPKIHIRLYDGSVDNSELLPSVLGFYDYIKRQPKRSIVSTQIFSHGYYDGPIIWNPSYENVDESDFSQDRDPHDSEFRRRDFFGRNPLAGLEGVRFAQALSTNAFIKIWGCNKNDDYKTLIDTILKAKQDASGRIESRTSLENYINTLKATFALLLSQTIKQTVWAAPVGWSTRSYNINRESFKYAGQFPPNLRTELWWRVPTLTLKYRRFFTSTLGARLDSTCYLGYKNGWFQTIRANLRDMLSW